MTTTNNQIKPILLFIENFRNKHPDFQHLFTNGLCYHFAAILKSIFFGEIMYNDITNHFAFYDGVDILDITGVIDSEGFELWEIYLRKERLNSGRVVDECVLLKN